MAKDKPDEEEFDEEIEDMEDDMSGLEDLERQEITGEDDDSSLSTSSTDEDEDEAVGDGNIGRSDDDPFNK